MKYITALAVSLILLAGAVAVATHDVKAAEDIATVAVVIFVIGGLLAD